MHLSLYDIVYMKDVEIIYCPYIPYYMTQDEAEESRRKHRAGKTYAKVKMSNGSSAYRNKTGEVTAVDGDRYQLYIDVMNTTSRSGMSTWIGVVKGGPGYQKVWFDKEDLAEIWKYDQNGLKV